MGQTNSDDEIYDAFKDNVNMTAGELEKWLASDESKSVGVKNGTTADKKTEPGGKESTGHEMGERIVHMLRTSKHDLNDEDYTHMKKVSGYVKRHLAQKPSKEDIEESRWRYSLMNWGYDPLKKS